MLNSPLAASAVAEPERWKWIRLGPPCQSRIRANTASTPDHPRRPLSSSTGRKKLSVDGKGSQLKTTFRLSGRGCGACRPALHLSVVRQFGSHRLARSWSCPHGGWRRAQLSRLHTPFEQRLKISARVAARAARFPTLRRSQNNTAENRAGGHKPEAEAREREGDPVRMNLCSREHEGLLRRAKSSGSFSC